MDSDSRIILGVNAESPDRGGEIRSASKLLKDLHFKFDLFPESIIADKGYFTGNFLGELSKENITPYIPYVINKKPTGKGKYTIKDFIYDEKKDEYICPAKKRLIYKGIHKRNNHHIYRCKKDLCMRCHLREKCTEAKFRSLSMHVHYKEIEKAKEISRTQEYRKAQYKRKTIEALFGEAKTLMGLRRAKFRKRKYVEEQFLMTAAAQNLKRMVKHIKDKLKEDKMSSKTGLNHLNLIILRLFVTIFFDFSKIQTSYCRFYGILLV